MWHEEVGFIVITCIFVSCITNPIIEIKRFLFLFAAIALACVGASAQNPKEIELDPVNIILGNSFTWETSFPAGSEVVFDFLDSNEDDVVELEEKGNTVIIKGIALGTTKVVAICGDNVIHRIVNVVLRGAGMTRTYARKGNVVIGTQPGSKSTTLFVCTDSTRTEYLVGNEKKQYAKVREKSGFSSVDDAIYQYLKSQMSETVFGKQYKKGDEGVTAKDTVIFGRPAYVLTKETHEKNAVAEVWGKGILHVDKENGLPYYKWAVVKNNGNVISEGKVFEITEFSANPTYDGLIVSLDDLTEISK